jgi:hypothetical protein
MKLKPINQEMAMERGSTQQQAILHAAAGPELDAAGVRQRATRMSSVLTGILNRRDSPEHIPLER